MKPTPIIFIYMHASTAKPHATSQSRASTILASRIIRASGIAVVTVFGAFAQPLHATTSIPWDLTYQATRAESGMGKNEFMYSWPRESNRPVHEKMAAYAGEPIEASLLIERPDHHAGDPAAIWIIKTRSQASACYFHPKSLNQPCQSIAPARADRFIREVASFKPVVITTPALNVLGKAANGSPILINYIGFLSTYIDGRATQRPIALSEFTDFGEPPAAPVPPETGRIERALAKLILPDAEYAARESLMASASVQQAFEQAVLRGDLTEMKTRLSQGARMEADPASVRSEPALALAAGAGNTLAVDFLLSKGAKINASESAALRAAVRSDKPAMVSYLLARGAAVDPPKDSLNSYGTIFQSPLGEAVHKRNLALAKLLIEKGANVNIAQSRTMLATAASGLDVDMVDLLLRHGARPDAVADSDIGTPIMFLANFGNASLSAAASTKDPESMAREEVLVEAIIRKLVKAGAKVNYVNRSCSSAISQARDSHNAKLEALLKTLGADPEISNKCRMQR